MTAFPLSKQRTIWPRVTIRQHSSYATELQQELTHPSIKENMQSSTLFLIQVTICCCTMLSFWVDCQPVESSAGGGGCPMLIRRWGVICKNKASIGNQELLTKQMKRFKQMVKTFQSRAKRGLAKLHRQERKTILRKASFVKSRSAADRISRRALRKKLRRTFHW